MDRGRLLPACHLVAATAVCLLVVGCGRRAEQPAERRPPRQAKAAGLLEGSVRLAANSTLPSLPPEAMEKKVLDQLSQAAPPPSCTPPKIVDRQPVRLTDEGALSGVLVALSNFSHQPTRPPRVHDVVIEDCRLVPPLVVAMKGDRLRVANRVDYAFMPGLGDDPMVRTLAMGQTYEVPLDQPGVRALTCGFTAPCGRTDVVVMLHPFYTVTDSAGRFRFDDFPANQAITVSAWHPLFREAQLEIQLEPGEQKRVELTLQPSRSDAVPAPESPRPPAESGKVPAPGR